MACAICKIRREKRPCPGVEGQICTLCCGTQREESIDCPLDCEYLLIAHQHEGVQKNPADIPNRDFPVPKDFLAKNVEIIISVQHAILMGAVERNAIDFDVREALDGLVRTYQTRDSGLYFDSRPSNPIAAAIFDGVQKRIDEIRKLESERGIHKLLESQILTMLVFLQQLEFTFNNGRKRGKGYLGNIYLTLADVAEQIQPEPSSLLIS